MQNTAHHLPLVNAATHRSWRTARALPAPDLQIRLVSNSQEQRAADHLVRRMYTWRGYQATANSFDATRQFAHMTVCAWLKNELVATISLTSGNQPLLCEALYPTEIGAMRASGQQLCEYSRLAIDPEHSTPKLMEEFFLAAYQLADKVFEASHAVVEINPRHRRYYERELGFQQIGPRRTCPRVDAPALLMHRSMKPYFKPHLQSHRQP